jgi:ADP-heptose:LPS heptosyltransferase
MEPLMDLGLYGESDVPELAPGAARMEEGRRALAGAGGEGRSMVIHPGSGGAAKKWPMKRFLKVAARLEAAGWRVYWSFGEADEDEREAWRAAGSPGTALEEGELGRLAAVLAQADGYLGNDSGVTHLAAAAGCRTLALFGPSDADKWAPKGRGGVRVLRAPADCMGELSVDAVWAAAAEWFV